MRVAYKNASRRHQTTAAHSRQREESQSAAFRHEEMGPHIGFTTSLPVRPSTRPGRGVACERRPDARVRAASAVRMVAEQPVEEMVNPLTILDTVFDPALPDENGRFGRFGGRYVPETLMTPLLDLEAGYRKVREDPEFKKELNDLLRDFVGRKTPLYFAERLTKRYAREDGSGPQIYLKVSPCDNSSRVRDRAGRARE